MSSAPESGAPRPVSAPVGQPDTADRRPDPVPTAKAVRRRAEILHAAHEVFTANGFRNGSLSDIAARVGITHQGILHYFGSKEQLLVEVLRDRDASAGDEYEQAERPHGAALLRHILWTVEQNEKRSGIVQVYTVLSAESVTEGHPAQLWFRDRFEVLRADIAGALSEICGPEAGVSHQQLQDGAAALVAVMDGLQVQWLLDPQAVAMPSVVLTTLNALLASWGRPPLD